MERTKNSVYFNSVKLIFHNSLSLILGQGFILFLGTILLTPLISSIYRLNLSLTGFRHVTVDNIGRFIIHPVNLIAIILLFYLIGLFLLFEIYYLITFFTMIHMRRKLHVLSALSTSFVKVLYGVIKGNLKLIPLAWMTMILFNFPLFFYTFSKTRLIRYTIDEMPDQLFWLILVLVLTGMLYGVLIRKPFLFHYYFFDKMDYSKSVKLSKSFKKNKPIRTFFYFLGWNICIVLIVLIIYAFTMAVTVFFVSSTFDRRLAIASFISINDSLKIYLSIVIFLISTIGNYALYTQLFYHYKLIPEDVEGNDEFSENIISSVTNRSGRSYKNILLTTASLLILINCYLFINMLRNGSPLDYMNLDSIKVTSHRGFSHSVPENTLPAIEKAIAEHADYVEIDVRMTKDGELVLLHDTNLKRTTGLNKSIWSVNYDTVASLDAGSWMDQSFAGTRIPTLREVFEECKGKIFLNLDLKYRNPQEGLAEKVVALIKEYNMEWQCVVSSTSLPCLDTVKELDPKIQTGYITYQLYPGITEKDDVDFFSMKSNLITKSVLRSIHKEGKELHVWTVNSRSELERLQRIGVDNIITDNPAFVKEVLYDTDSDWYLTTLFKVIVE